MPTIREYRVVMPLTLEEFERGRRWHKVEQIKLEQKLLQDETIKVTEFGERTLLREEIRKIPAFYSGNTIREEKTVEHLIKGFGTSSPCAVPVPFPLVARIGCFIDIMITKAVTLTHVESWEAYPYFSSVSTNSSLGSHYKMVIEGICLPGSNTEENALNLEESVLKDREVILVDIASNVSTDDYRDGKDPILFRSTKTGRGPLEPDVWMKETQPCLTSYILISINYDFLGPIGTLAEKKLHDGIHRAMKLHHRELFCYIDEWIDFPLEELLTTGVQLQKELEETVETKLELLNNAGKIKPVVADDLKDLVENPPEEDFIDALFRIGKPVTRPIEIITTKVLAVCSHHCAGGSIGYSICITSFILCIVAFLVSFLLRAIVD